jgi:hypothetical protein
MLASGIPTKIAVPFASSAGGAYVRTIPVASQIGVNPGFASFTDGFVPLNGTPVSAGGVPPFEQDLNGILLAITNWNRWQNAGGPIPYDATFQTAISGYPLGAIVASATSFGVQWLSSADANVTNPDAGGAGWIQFNLNGGTFVTGDIKTRADGIAQTGWTRCNGNSIGDASSGATERANADCSGLFSYLWTNFSNSQCPVSGGRGGSAAADFAAHKTIGLLDLRGYVGVVGGDTMGSVSGPASRFTGVTFATGSQNTPGSLFGSNAVTLTLAQIPTFTPSGSVAITDPTHFHALPISNNISGAASNQAATFAAAASNTSPASTGVSAAFTGVAVGGGTSHQNMQLGIIGTIYMKL